MPGERDGAGMLRLFCWPAAGRRFPVGAGSRLRAAEIDWPGCHDTWPVGEARLTEIVAVILGSGGMQGLTGPSADRHHRSQSAAFGRNRGLPLRQKGSGAPDSCGLGIPAAHCVTPAIPATSCVAAASPRGMNLDADR